MSYNNCRFCKKFETDGSNSLVKYGTRHYAHYRCYLEAGKSLDDLHAWQLGHFPFRMVRDLGLLPYFEARAENEKRRKAALARQSRQNREDVK